METEPDGSIVASEAEELCDRSLRLLRRPGPQSDDEEDRKRRRDAKTSRDERNGRRWPTSGWSESRAVRTSANMLAALPEHVSNHVRGTEAGFPPRP